MVDTDDTRRTIHDGRRTTPGVWHKLPTGELKKPVPVWFPAHAALQINSNFTKILKKYAFLSKLHTIRCIM